MWARSLRILHLGLIPCYRSPRFSNNEMDLVSYDAVDFLEDRCSSRRPKTNQRRARLAAM